MIESYTIMPLCGDPSIVKIDGENGGVVSITSSVDGTHEIKSMLLSAHGHHGVSYDLKRLTEVEFFYICILAGVPIWPPEAAIPYFQELHEYDPDEFGPRPDVDYIYAVEHDKFLW